MASDLIPYHKMRALVIEDMPEMRTSLKSMLTTLGIQRTDLVSTGEEALERLYEQSYDLIFSDYELGKGKDGQQVLEEARHNGILPAAAVYIVISAAQTADMVMGILEFEPDGYIAKPVTLDLLRTRLNRIIRTKDVYRGVNTCLDKNDLNGALEACNRLALEQPRFALAAYKIKGRLLVRAERYPEARELYEMVLGIKQVAWAVLGLGKVEFIQGNLDRAEKLLDSLVKTHVKYVEAADWLARIQEAHGHLRAAQRVLENALVHSPKSALRQYELARVAELNSDAETFYKAARKAYLLSRQSVFANADYFIRYARSLQPTIRHGNHRDSKTAATEALKLIETVQTRFELAPAQLMQCALIEATTRAGNDDMKHGKACYQAAIGLAKSVKLTMDHRLELFAAQLIFEQFDDPMKFGSTLLQRLGNDIRLQSRYYAILDFYLRSDPVTRLILLKQRGHELLQKGMNEEALELLNKASALDPDDPEIEIEALTSLINLYEGGEWSTARLQRTNELLLKLATLDEESPAFRRLTTQQQRWAELQTQ